MSSLRGALVRTGALMSVVALAVAACGSSDDSGSGSADSTPPSGPAALEVLASADHGQVVASRGFALYVFSPDAGAAAPTCIDDCAQLWPPLTSEGAATAEGGLDGAQLGTITRLDGTEQVTFNGWPLYFYSPDGEGDTSGQGVGGNWWLLDSAGVLVETAATGSATTASSGGYGY